MTEASKKAWKEFLESKYLWWVNRSLHLLGWAIEIRFDEEKGEVADVIPVRVDTRGFSREVEEEGFQTLTKSVLADSTRLLRAVK